MEDLMQRYQVTDEKALSAIETGAKMLADDVRKLPKPRSKRRKKNGNYDKETAN